MILSHQTPTRRHSDLLTQSVQVCRLGSRSPFCMALRRSCNHGFSRRRPWKEPELPQGQSLALHQCGSILLSMGPFEEATTQQTTGTAALRWAGASAKRRLVRGIRVARAGTLYSRGAVSQVLRQCFHCWGWRTASSSKEALIIAELFATAFGLS